MAAPAKRKRIVGDAQQDVGKSVSVSSSWRTLLCEEGLYTGYDAWSMNDAPTKRGVALAHADWSPVAYTPEVGVQAEVAGGGGGVWNAAYPAGAENSWTVVLDAPFDVQALTVKGFVQKKLYSTELDGVGIWRVGVNLDLPAANACRMITGVEDTVAVCPLVRLNGLPQSIRGVQVHGRLDEFTGERVCFQPAQQFQQRAVTIDLLDGAGGALQKPHYLMRPPYPLGQGRAVEYTYNVTITLHEAVSSQVDWDANA